MIDGTKLIAWGFKPGKWFEDALPALNDAEAAGLDEDGLSEMAQGFMPVDSLMRTNSLTYVMLLDAETELERRNAAQDGIGVTTEARCGNAGIVAPRIAGGRSKAARR
jgi:hypothetical protein